MIMTLNTDTTVWATETDGESDPINIKLADYGDFRVITIYFGETHEHLGGLSIHTTEDIAKLSRKFPKAHITFREPKDSSEKVSAV